MKTHLRKTITTIKNNAEDKKNDDEENGTTQAPEEDIDGSAV
jgi:hypothetical protein